MAWFLPFIEGMTRRLSGPGSFRFLLQPVMAIALGIRDGLADVRAGQPAYLIGFFYQPERRRELLADVVKQTLKPFFFGVILDLIFQVVLFHRIRLLPAIVVGMLLISLPYALTRGITNRIATGWRTRRNPLPAP